MDLVIPSVDFGGDGPLLHFAHANGYPPGSYRQFLTALAGEYHPVAMCARPLWGGQEPEADTGFHTFGRDLIHFCVQQGIRQAIGVGHSLGAVATMYAAVERPDLFRRLVLIEPVFLAPEILAIMQQHPEIVSGPLEDLPLLRWWPALLRRTRQRRTRWADREEAFAHFRAKPVFERLSDTALRDYVTAGTRELTDGTLTLAYPREWEAAIYARPPLDVWQVAAQVQQPTVALRAGESNTLSPTAWQHWQTVQPQAVFQELPGVTHLLTMEEPQRVADVVRELLG